MFVITSAMEMPMRVEWRQGRWVGIAEDWWAGARREKKDRLLLTCSRGLETSQTHTRTQAHTHIHTQSCWGIEAEGAKTREIKFVAIIQRKG